MHNAPEDKNLDRPVYERYDDIADWYAQVRHDAHLEKPYLDKILSSMPAKGHVLDIGCGSGLPIAQYLIARGHRLTGIDGSARLLSCARAAFPDEQWIHQDIRQLTPSFPTFDAVIAWGVLFHLTQEEQQTLFAVVSTLLKPGAPFLFTTDDADDGESVQWGEMAGVAFPHFGLPPQRYRDMLARSGWAVIAMKAKDPDCGEQTIWILKRQL